MKPIETHYGGYRFRSRLEARWYVVFEHLGIEAHYEPQGFVVDGRPYLPDFWLPATGTWVEVKGSEAELDHGLMMAAAEELPRSGDSEFPHFLVVGPIPEPVPEGDFAWAGFTSLEMGGDIVSMPDWWTFHHGTLRFASETSYASPVSPDEIWLVPAIDMQEHPDEAVAAAYLAGRYARFEHGEKG